MTYSTLHSKPSKPTLKYLRDLAEKTGQSFEVPQTQAEASQEISRLKALRSVARSDRRRESREIAQELSGAGGALAAIHDDEISGYGGAASWT